MSACCHVVAVLFDLYSFHVKRYFCQCSIVKIEVACQEILQGRSIAPDEKIVHEVAILPNTKPEQLVKDIGRHIGYPMILYNGEAEHGKGGEVPDHVFFRMMEAPFPHVMREDVIDSVARELLSSGTTRIVFTDP